MSNDLLSPPEEASAVPASKSKNKQFETLRLIFFQPVQAFAEVTKFEKKANWLAPVIIVLVLAVVAALLSTQTTSRTTAAFGSTRGSTQTTTQTTRTSSSSRSGGNTTSGQAGQGAFPGGPGGAMPPEAMMGGGAFGGTTGSTTASNGSAAAASSTNLWIAGGLPAVSFLISWLLLGVLTNLLSVAFGGHSNAIMAMNIAAWSSIPLGVRNLMQIFYYLATGSAITAPGLAGFAPTPGTNSALIYLQQVLSRIDIYLFWEIGLLAVGISAWGGIAKKKSVPAAIMAAVILLALQALLAFGLQLLGNVNVNTNMLLRLR